MHLVKSKRNTNSPGGGPGRTLHWPTGFDTDGSQGTPTDVLFHVHSIPCTPVKTRRGLQRETCISTSDLLVSSFARHPPGKWGGAKTGL